MKAFTIATLFFAGALAVPFSFDGAVAGRDVADLGDPNRMKGTHGSGKRGDAEQSPQAEVDNEGIIGQLIKIIDLEFQNRQQGDQQAPGDGTLKRRVSPPVPANGTATVGDPEQAAGDVTVGAAIDVLGQFAGAAGDEFPALREAAAQLNEAIQNFNQAAQSVPAPAVKRAVLDEHVAVTVSAREATAGPTVPEGSIGTFLDVVENIAVAVGKKFPDLSSVAKKLEEAIQAFRNAAKKIDVTIPKDA